MASAQNSSKLRNYCFTLFAEPDDGPLEAGQRFVNLIESSSGFPCCRFMVGQLEQCPETERLHLQGYFELTRPQRITWIKANWPGFDRAWFEPRRGTQQEAVAYCEKEESRIDGPWRCGEPTTKGKRSDLDAIALALNAGETVSTVGFNFPSTFMRYGRGIRDYANLVRALIKVDWEMEVIVLWGAPGSGKTSLAKSSFPDAYEWMPQRGNTVWWDGYMGEHTIIIDEFANNFPYHYALRILGDAGCRVEFKGGTVQLMAKRIVVTSMDSPLDWWKNMTEHRYALYRRIHFCYKLTGDAKLGTSEMHPDHFPVLGKRPDDMWRDESIEDNVENFIFDIESIESMRSPTHEEWELGSTQTPPF